MSLRAPRLAIALTAVLALTGCAGPSLVSSPLQFAPVDTGKLVAGDRPLTVVVKDERPADAILAGGLLGPKGEEGDGLYFGYVPEKPGELAALVESAAKEAATILGFAPGASGGPTLEIALKSFRIDLYRSSGFSPMNCAGYGLVAAKLTGPAGEPLQARDVKVAFYENTSPAMSMKEVTREALSRIYTQAAWEAIAALLVPQYALKGDPAALARVLDAMGSDKDEIRNRRRAYWLGVLGKDDPRVRTKLLDVFRNSKDPRFREGAVEALGRFGATEARDDILKALSGAPLGDWKIKDAEQAWYLVKALWMMGETDLAAKVPPPHRKQIADEIAFLTTGELPPLGQKESQELSKARQRRK